MSNPQYPPPTAGSSGGNGTLILVLGIISLVPCLNIVGPVAWIMGNNALPMASADQRGQVNAGRICGIIGTVFLVLSILYWIFVVGFVGTHRNQFVPPPTVPTR